jgi:methionine synthase II (cobalamin-independent)
MQFDRRVTVATFCRNALRTGKIERGLDIVNDGELSKSPCVAPAGLAVDFANEHYPSDDELTYAFADALHEEYREIIEAGFQVQVDDAWLTAIWNARPELELDDYRHYVTSAIEALNHALRGLPEDRLRYHTPRTTSSIPSWSPSASRGSPSTSAPIA